MIRGMIRATVCSFFFPSKKASSRQATPSRQRTQPGRKLQGGCARRLSWHPPFWRPRHGEWRSHEALLQVLGKAIDGTGVGISVSCDAHVLRPSRPVVLAVVQHQTQHLAHAGPHSAEGHRRHQVRDAELPAVVGAPAALVHEREHGTASKDEQHSTLSTLSSALRTMQQGQGMSGQHVMTSCHCMSHSVTQASMHTASHKRQRPGVLTRPACTTGWWCARVGCTWSCTPPGCRYLPLCRPEGHGWACNTAACAW